MNQKIIIAVIIIVGAIAGVYAYAQANNLIISPPPIVQMFTPTVSKPLVFYTPSGGASSNYDATTKILTINVMSPNDNWNYTVILTDNNKNSLINKTFFPNVKERSASMTFDTTGTAKPLYLVVKYNNIIVYTAYHGSPFEP